MCVARTVEAAEGGSATLPCRFTFHESVKPSRISVAWRIEHFNGQLIFNNTGNPTFISKLFTNGLALVGDPHKREASLQITNVRRSDQNTYFCRIMFHTSLEKFEFQIIPGTNLIIQGSISKTTQSPTAPSHTEDSRQPSQPPGLAACVHTVALASLATVASLLICANCIIVVVFMRGRDTRDAQ
ncbi:unnamed protein product [Lampetra planeri]